MKEENKMMSPKDKYLLTIKETSAYFSIGETKLRALIQDPALKSCILKNGNKVLIKRKQMEKYIDRIYEI